VELAKRYKVSAYPSLVFIESNGDLKGTIVGFREPAAFLSEAADLLAGVKASDRMREALAKDPNDPSLKMDLATALVREESFEEALELYLWCWDHGDDSPAYGFTGVRVSFLTSKLGKLARVYPPALKALGQRADAAKAIVLGEKPTDAETRDFIALNRALNKGAETLEVYDALLMKRKDKPEIGGFNPLPRLFDEVTPMLIKAKRYQEVVDGYDEPTAWFRQRLAKFNSMKDAMGGEESFMDYLYGKLRRDTGQFYLALLGTRKHDELAAGLAAKIVEFDPSLATWQMLLKSAGVAEREDIQSELRTAAMKSLPEKDRSKLKD